MSKNSEKDTSLTLMMRVQQNAADPQAWDAFVQRYQPMILRVVREVGSAILRRR